MFIYYSKTFQLLGLPFLYVICLCYGESPPLKGVQSIFEAFGYSPSCVAVALATCAANLQPLSSTVLRDAVLKEKLSKNPRNCADIRALGDTISGIRTVYPFICCPNRPISVLCDQDGDEGGWTVIQKRTILPQREDFYRTWIEYVLGFGNLTGEFWLGLENIHALVGTTLMELKVDLEDFEGEKRWARYEYFHVGDSESKYILSIGKYTGNAGDSLTASHNGFKFSTHDADNDKYPENCAQKFRGAWWYSSCHDVNLNGFQYEGKHASYADGIHWNAFKGHYYSLKTSVMSVRPKFQNL